MRLDGRVCRLALAIAVAGILAAVLRSMGGPDFQSQYLYLFSSIAQSLAGLAGLAAVAGVYRMGTHRQSYEVQLQLLHGAPESLIREILDRFFKEQDERGRLLFAELPYPMVLAGITIAGSLVAVPYSGRPQNHFVAAILLAAAGLSIAEVGTYLHNALRPAPSKVVDTVRRQKAD